MRDEKGKYLKGHGGNPETQFKPGQHWRQALPFRKRSYLLAEYVEKKRSASDIAREFHVTPHAVIFWLRRHEIERRSISETRQVKHWGPVGESNPQFGKRGSETTNWRGGCTPERQAFYCSQEWAEACRIVWIRDEATCQRCGVHSAKDIPFHVHHVVSFQVIHLRAAPHNLKLLCEKCHHWVHSRRNTNKEFIQSLAE